MSGTPENFHTRNEKQIEDEVRALLAPLDRRVDRTNTLLGCSMILGTPAGFVILWLVVEFRWWVALLWTLGLFVVVVMVGVGLDTLWARAVARRFDQRFPREGNERALALEILSQMQTPSGAEQRLQEALADTAEERITRHRPVNVDQQIEDALAHFSPSSPPPDTIQPEKRNVTRSSPSASESSSERPESEYPHIPLELPEDDPPTRN